MNKNPTVDKTDNKDVEEMLNDETKLAIKEALSGENMSQTFSTVDALMEDLNDNND